MPNEHDHSGAAVELDERFVVIPESLLYDPTVSAKAKVVYAILRRHGDEPATCYPSHARIASLMGFSERSVPAWIAELEALGWVEVIARFRDDGGRTSNAYRVASVRDHHPATRRGADPATRRGGDPAAERDERKQVERKQVERKKEHVLALVDTHPPDYRWPDFWDAYPKRNGKRVGKAKAMERWCRLSYDDKAAAFRGVRHYRAHCDAGLSLAKDAERWLRDRLWTDWQEPADPAAPLLSKREQRMVANGTAGRIAEALGLAAPAIDTTEAR